MRQIAENLIKHARGHFDATGHVMSVLYQVKYDIFVKDQVTYNGNTYLVWSVDELGICHLLGKEEVHADIKELKLHYRPKVKA